VSSPARRAHPTDRVVSRTVAGLRAVSYVIRSSHWDSYRAEVWVDGDLIFTADRKTKLAAERLADSELDSAVQLLC